MATLTRAFLGSDHAGYELKDAVRSHLVSRGVEAIDLGSSLGERCDYPVAAIKVARAVAGEVGSLGFLFCGSGVGVSIAANKVRGIRSVVCSEPYSGRMAREHNDANVLALGQRVVGVALALMIVDAFLDAGFEGGRHAQRLALISALEGESGSLA